jgi:hypothetical protein
MDDISDFRQTMISAGEGDENIEFRTTVFVERACEILTGGEVIESAELTQWQGGGPRQKKFAISAAAFHGDDGSVSLVLAHFDGSHGEAPQMGTAEITKSFRMLTGFLEAALNGALADKLEKSSRVGELIVTLRERQAAGSLIKARFFLVTDAKISDRVRELSPETVAGIPCELQVWDIGRLSELKGKGHEALQINIGDFGESIPCLPVHLPTGDYKSYLCVIPGHLLAALYERFGARLLETNVRGFLADHGKVNRGLRATIQLRPQMFFAFNNGLTATAKSVTISKTDAGEVIDSINDLQIVNGGQTTASLFWARKKHKASLDNVFVQMKLSVIPQEMSDQFDQIVSDISKFANSQNKVSDADLFANHAFHRGMEKISRRTGVAATGGGQYQTYWFYERARAQYQNQRAALAGKERTRFDERFPKAHLVSKTDFAKYLNTWEQLPHVVSSGAQKSFKRFADVITKRWEKNSDQFNEVFFKRAIGIGILFKALERLIQGQPWYEGHRAAIVPYTLATLSYALEGSERKLNLLGIWSKQQVTEAAEGALVEIAAQVWKDLSSHADRKTRAQWGNLGEWFKTEQCWVACKNLNIRFPDAMNDLTITDAQYRSQDTAGLQGQKVGAGIDAQSEVQKLTEDGYWQRLKDWNQEDPVLTEAEFEGVCRLLGAPSTRVPTEFESRLLIEAKGRAETHGFL